MNPNSKKPRLIRPVYFVWMVVPIILFGIYHAYGLPHMVWSYRFHDNGDRYNPYAERYYTDCTFIGPYGKFTRSTRNGKCSWISFFKETSQGRQS